MLQILVLLRISPALAVSFGDELILSRLGDPVEIEIEVLQWEDIELERVQISAASREDYDVFNLTWLPVLDELRFNLVGPDLDGDVRVLISSRDPLNEPFLELLLVLRWPGGSLRREYVLLFDPPGAPTALVAPAIEVPGREAAAALDAPVIATPAFDAQRIIEPAGAETTEPAPIVAESAPVVQQGAAPEPLVQVQPLRPAQVVPAAVPAPALPNQARVDVGTAQPAPAPGESSDATVPTPDARTQVAIEVETLAPQTPTPVLEGARRTYRVRAGDSLWNIARQFTPAGVGENLYQMLLSMHDLNRNAFINGNISLLKANSLLEVPAADDIASIDPLSAEAEFNRRWQQGTQRIDVTQGGEPVALFADEAPEAKQPVEVDDLPPGIEVPPVGNDTDGLVMVSQSEVAQPLQIGTAGKTDVAVDATAPTETEAVPAAALQIETRDAAPKSPQPREPDTQSLEPQQEPDSQAARSASVPLSPAVVAVNAPQTAARAVIAAELESEVELMRARRQSAEALALQLNATLQQAQAQKMALGSFFAGANLLWTGGVLVLLGALIAAVVTSLKIASDLRLRGAESSAALERNEPAWIDQGLPRNVARRTIEVPVAEMDVVELDMSNVTVVTTPADVAAVPQSPAPGSLPPRAAVDGDLFARLENMLGDDQPISSKNT